MAEAEFNQEPASVADEALYAGLLSVQVVQAIQQAYADGKIIDLESYNHLYAIATKSDVQVRKLAMLLEKKEGTTH